MNRRSPALAAAAALLAISSLACAGKKPSPPPAVAPAPANAVEVAPSSRPAIADAAASDLPSDLVELNAEVVRRGLLGDVYFEYDQATLDPGALDRLSKNADFLNSHREYVVTIEGHCDERGTNDYNLALGARRAGAARDFAASLGVAPVRLETISYGEERPQCSESSEGCWARNRRAHFVITGRASGN